MTAAALLPRAWKKRLLDTNRRNTNPLDTNTDRPRDYRDFIDNQVRARE